MKKITERTLKHLAVFFIEVVIPFVCAPLFPMLIKGCTESESIIIGSCISIFLAVWGLAYSLSEKSGKYSSAFMKHDQDTNRGLKSIGQRLSTFEYFLDFIVDIDKVMHPYFKRRINESLLQCLENFKQDNRMLYDGYTVTEPYSEYTFGAIGLQYTRRELLAVSSVHDYWERTAFIEHYLDEQYSLIREKAISITRIFVGSRELLNSNSLKRIMADQLMNGITVLYLETDTGYCREEWKEQDFLIQDESLVVQLRASTHKPSSETEEIITSKPIDIIEKRELFDAMRMNSQPFHA